MSIPASGSARPHLTTTGLIGTPIEHSLSPVIHDAVYPALGLPWHYGSIECPDEAYASQTIAASRADGFIGMNITMPYKELAAKAADELDASAVRVRGANVLSCVEGRLIGYNTDGAGVVGSLTRQGKITVSGEDFMVCGSGPAARAAIAGLLDAGAGSVHVMSRDIARSRALCDTVGDARLHAHAYEGAAWLMPHMAGIVDATSSGMHEHDRSVLPPEGFVAGQVLLDVVYAHGLTEIVSLASSAGAVAFDGLGMLIEQGALTIEIWARDHGFGEVDVSRDVMMHAAEQELARRAGV